MVKQLDLGYPAILDRFGAHRAKGRAESRAFLAWFLEHYYHLDEQGSQDAVCDGPDDKGIDGIFVDDNLERVDVFQSKLYQNTQKTVGDKSFAGSRRNAGPVGGRAKGSSPRWFDGKQRVETAYRARGGSEEDTRGVWAEGCLL